MGILQKRILEWVVVPCSRGSPATQGSDPGLLHCKLILYHLSHQGSPHLQVSCIQLTSECGQHILTALKENESYAQLNTTNTTKILHHNNHQKSFLNVCYGHFFRTNWKDIIAASNGAIFSSHKALGTMPST